MPTTPSPLRYPGGKTKLYDIVRDIINKNNLHNTYIEPFAGGAGLALKLLFKNDVKKIIINDSDLAIYALWYSVLNHTDIIYLKTSINNDGCVSDYVFTLFAICYNLIHGIHQKGSLLGCLSFLSCSSRHFNRFPFLIFDLIRRVTYN